MKFRWEKQFIKRYQKLPQQIQKQSNQKLGFLLSDIKHPSLRIKKVKGLKTKTNEDIFELSITKNYRLLFLIRDETYILLTIGTHDEILGR